MMDQRKDSAEEGGVKWTKYSTYKPCFKAIKKAELLVLGSLHVLFWSRSTDFDWKYEQAEEIGVGQLLQGALYTAYPPFPLLLTAEPTEPPSFSSSFSAATTTASCSSKEVGNGCLWILWPQQSEQPSRGGEKYLFIA